LITRRRVARSYARARARRVRPRLEFFIGYRESQVSHPERSTTITRARLIIHARQRRRCTHTHRRRLLDYFFNALINVISGACARLRKHASHRRGIDDNVTRVTLVTTAGCLHSRVCSIAEHFISIRERAKLSLADVSDPPSRFLASLAPGQRDTPSHSRKKTWQAETATRDEPARM
jgi:hypothetical protein